jgi:tyrosyl-tRNA synthetase
MTTLIDELKPRGLLQDLTPGLPDRLAQGPITGYCGFDPTADSLHVGHLLPVMGLVWLQKTGGTPIVLVGGGTGMVGDPSGKRSERPVLTVEAIDHNVACIKAQLEKFVSFEGKNAARVVNNADWLRPLGLMEFLRDCGKHFTVNYMLAKDSVKNRMESGISFTEFTYQLVQAYDFWFLLKQHGCELQMGGSDQWGNITAGTEFISRKEGRGAHGLVFPLLTTASGAKFGKTEEGAVWLDPAKTSPYKFFQFWLNTDDRDIERVLKFFSLAPMAEVNALFAEHDVDRSKRVAQRRLAEEMTARVHGAAVAKGVVEASRILFGGSDLRAASADTLGVLAGEIPAVKLAKAELSGLGVLDALVKSGLASSKGDARRGVQGKGFSVNGAVVEAPERTLSADDLLAGRFVMLQKGKKNYAVLVVE